jgi:signal transduction histidine kinase
MKRAHIEPELLSLFRLTYGFWLVIYIPDLLEQLENPIKPILPLVLIGTFTSVVMLLYLYSGWLQRCLSRWYFPIGLILASVGAILGQWFNIVWGVYYGVSPSEERVDQWLFTVLFVPMIIVGAQYNFRAVLAFTAFTAAAQGLLILPLTALDGAPIQLMKDDITGRFIVYPLVGFIVARSVTGQKSERKALAAKNDQLTRYATTVERLAISHERNRLAREMHDTLAHTLSAVAVQLEALNKQLDKDPDNAKHTIKQLQDLTRSGLQEARCALQALRSSPLEDLGLTLAVQQLVASAAERSGIPITLTLLGDVEGLSPEVEQSIYRITEEALNNIIRHASAPHVEVSLRRDLSTLCLTIRDDGIGFDPKTAPLEGHYGLVGMHERALLCNGRLEINSVPGAGTTVQLTVEE